MADASDIYVHVRMKDCCRLALAKLDAIRNVLMARRPGLLLQSLVDSIGEESVPRAFGRLPRIRAPHFDYLTQNDQDMVDKYQSTCRDHFDHHMTLAESEEATLWLNLQGMGAFGNPSTANALELAREARAGAKPPGHKGGYCYRAAKKAISQMTGTKLTGGSAYMAAEQLASSSAFRQVDVPQLKGAELRDWLRAQPPGSVFVYGKTAKHPDGHISIRTEEPMSASGAKVYDLEASDVLRDVVDPASYGSVQVFYPK